VKLFCHVVFSKQLSFTNKVAHEAVFQNATSMVKLSYAKQGEII
jgi:hypothetical protein